MSEPTLSLTYFDYRAEVGEYLGYGRGDEGGNTDVTWTTSQSTNVNKAVAAGQRQFYFPPVLDGEKTAHQWTFLKPIASLTYTSGTQTVALPADFGGFEGRITVTTASSGYAVPVQLVNEGVIRAQYALAGNTVSTGQPQMASLQPLKGVGVNQSSRWQLYIWPQADQDYTLKFPYFILPDALSGAKPYSYGGAQHVETVLASCLERAEFYKDNQRGVNWANWLDRLAASISLDRANGPQALGYNGNGLSPYSRTGGDGVNRLLFRNYWVAATLYGSSF